MKHLLIGLSLLITTSVFGQINRAMDDLFHLTSQLNYGKTNAQIIKESNDNYDRFVAINVNAPSYTSYSVLDAEKPKTITVDQAELALDAAMRNDIVSLDQYSKYDRENRGIGFCFGRAMFINLYLAINGLARPNIKKAFVVGPMSRGAWGWHVTTIAQSKDRAGKEIWLAIDPVMGYVVTVQEWYAHWQRSSDDGKLRLLITEAGKFGAGPSRYDEQGISNPFYNNYFTDMMKWFERNDISRELRLR